MKVTAALEEFFRPVSLQTSLEKTTIIAHFVSLLLRRKSALDMFLRDDS
jgi:hypothetical protein